MSQTLIATPELPDDETSQQDFALWAAELSSTQSTGEITREEIDERLRTGEHIIGAMAKELSDMAYLVSEMRALKERTGEHPRVELPLSNN